MGLKIDSKESGIYSITHESSGSVYVGCTQDFSVRSRQHELDLANGRHDNRHLQNAWKKYGSKEFRFSILETVEDIGSLLIREEYWIEKLGAEIRDRGYNVPSARRLENARVLKGEETNELKPVGTLGCLLLPDDAQAKAVETTFQSFADACNFINSRVETRFTHAPTIQQFSYEIVRERFKLPANLAVRAAARVSSSRKIAKALGKPVDHRLFLPNIVEFDHHTFAYRERDEQVRLTLVGGATRIAVRLCNYHRGKLKGLKPRSATIVKKDDGIYVNIKIPN